MFYKKKSARKLACVNITQRGRTLKRKGPSGEREERSGQLDNPGMLSFARLPTVQRLVRILV